MVSVLSYTYDPVLQRCRYRRHLQRRERQGRTKYLPNNVIGEYASRRPDQLDPVTMLQEFERSHQEIDWKLCQETAKHNIIFRLIISTVFVSIQPPLGTGQIEIVGLPLTIIALLIRV